MWHVGIERDNYGVGRSVTIRVANEDSQTGIANILMRDQSWVTLQPGVQPPVDTGIQLPMDCLRELQAALNGYFGDHGGDKELKADLLTEKRRVEEMHQSILRMMSRFDSTPYDTGGIMKGVSPSNP